LLTTIRAVIPRTPRADAVRNRSHVLDAARQLLAEHGDAVQMSDVARAAGVGVGTVYRHFATRQALVEAAAEQRFAEILAFGRSRCLRDPDPVHGLARLLRRTGEVLYRERGLSASLEAAMGSPEPRGEMRAQLESVAGTLIERGKAAGALRRDATVADVYMIVCGLAAVIRFRSGDWRRFVDVAVDGLRFQ
jgi:AcrR family transcriptional regulator